VTKKFEYVDHEMSDNDMDVTPTNIIDGLVKLKGHPLLPCLLGCCKSKL